MLTPEELDDARRQLDVLLGEVERKELRAADDERAYLAGARVTLAALRDPDEQEPPT